MSRLSITVFGMTCLAIGVCLGFALQNGPPKPNDLRAAEPKPILAPDDGKLRLDRTIEVSVTNRVGKKQILKRIGPNLSTIIDLLKRNHADFRIAAPSANLSGHVSATTSAHASEDLGAKVDLVLDAGPSAIGLESSIVAVSDAGVARLLRAGTPRQTPPHPSAESEPRPIKPGDSIHFYFGEDLTSVLWADIRTPLTLSIVTRWSTFFAGQRRPPRIALLFRLVMNLTRAFAVLCLLLPRLASAGIAFDASSGLRESALNASSLTYPVTVGSGLTDRIVVVLVPAYASTNVSVSLITYGGVPLTRVRRDANGVQLAYSEAWYLLAPAAGLHNVVVTMTGPVGSENAIYSGALSFSGVDQTTPIDAHAGSVVTGSHGAHGDTITTVTAGAWVVDGVATRNPPAAGGNQTQRWSGGAAHLERSGGSTRGPIATAGATAMNWTWATSGGASAHSVVALKPSFAGVPDATPPVLSNGAPSGALPAGTTQATLSVTTNENAVCRYSTTPGTAYAAMTGTFTVTGATSHSTTLVNVADGNSYARYLRCQDAAGNANGVDYAVSFLIGASRFLTASNWAAFTPAANGVGTLPKGFKGRIFDGRYSHFIPNFNGNSEVMRYDTTAPFTAAASWATFDPNPPSGGGYVGGAFDGRYVYFAPYRNGSLSIGEVLRSNCRDYKPGDIVAWALADGRPHIGLVTERRSSDGERPLVMHNIGMGPQIEDMLFGLTITGHFRYVGSRSAS